MTPLSSIILLSTDLLASSKLTGAAMTAGATLAMAGSVEGLLEKIHETAAKLVIVDLDLFTGDLPALVQAVHSIPGVAIIAFGPHVYEDKLTAATDAGCDEVFTRGHLHRNGAEIFRRYG